jgi:hypothetical protein
MVLTLPECCQRCYISVTSRLPVPPECSGPHWTTGLYLNLAAVDAPTATGLMELVAQAHQLRAPQ